MLAGVDQMTDELADVLFSAGCDDGIPFSAGGMAGIGFSREVGSLEEAVRSAIADVTRAGFSAGRVEPADAPVFAQINRGLAIH
jgi:hypothetical protein